MIKIQFSINKLWFLGFLVFAGLQYNVGFSLAQPVLKDYYGDLISIYANWNVWSSVGNISDLYTLSSEIGCEFWGIEENNIGHNLRSALVGPNMELLKVWEGDQWLAKDVRKDIENYMEIVK